jgi:hypothetical protein
MLVPRIFDDIIEQIIQEQEEDLDNSEDERTPAEEESSSELPGRTDMSSAA